MILYEGISSFDTAPIVVIATGYDTVSKNPKTGQMVQTWIMRSDINPFEAVKKGYDASVCSDCPQRWFKGGGCYVNPGYAPLNVFKKYKKGGYSKLYSLQDISDFGKDRNIRIGSYGDPGAVPLKVWEALALNARMYTGYTHAWRALRGPGWRKLFMASIDRSYDVPVANLLGWRSFRTGDTRQRSEMTCPASKEAGKKLTCMDCKACDGTNANGLTGKNVVINVHGMKSKHAKIENSPVEDLFLPYLIG